MIKKIIITLGLAMGLAVAPAMMASAAGGPSVTWWSTSTGYNLVLPASDAWEVKQITPTQHIFCGTNYGNPCSTDTFTLDATGCVTVQVDWAGRHGYNSDDYNYCVTTSTPTPTPTPSVTPPSLCQVPNSHPVPCGTHTTPPSHPKPVRTPPAVHRHHSTVPTVSNAKRLARTGFDGQSFNDGFLVALGLFILGGVVYLVDRFKDGGDPPVAA